MILSTKLDQLHAQAKNNRWLQYFAIFNRIALAIGFFIAGMVKIMGERFASGLSVNHPMGHYLEALHHTGYYYTFIGYAQVIAALLLLIPRTAVLGALLYFPIILNICILSLAVRFDGSLLSSPLMVLSNLYLLCWYYDRIKYILPFKPSAFTNEIPKPAAISNKFPFKFFAGVVATIIILGFVLLNVYDIMPRNTLSGCMMQCKNSTNPSACNAFCDSIHTKGQPLDKSMNEYFKALKAPVRVK
jgi:uncharacterized membrane protein YphA (DoxX/SURF4 family)